MRHSSRSLLKCCRSLAVKRPVVACTAVLGGVGPAVAQEQRQIEEIVVTSRFREENLQEIPLAISALTADMLAENGALSSLDVADWAPNVTLDQLGQGYGPTVAANI